VSRASRAVRPLQGLLEALLAQVEAVRALLRQALAGPGEDRRAVLGEGLRAADEVGVRYVSVAPRHAPPLPVRRLRRAGELLLDDRPVSTAYDSGIQQGAQRETGGCARDGEGHEAATSRKGKR
jgi:hypothetical protein